MKSELCTSNASRNIFNPSTVKTPFLVRTQLQQKVPVGVAWDVFCHELYDQLRSYGEPSTDTPKHNECPPSQSSTFATQFRCGFTEGRFY
jgi:hypothetical protein